MRVWNLNAALPGALAVGAAIMLRNVSVLFVLSIGICLALAAPLPNATSTEPSTSTSPQPKYQGWTASSNNRGTIDIIWSCLVTMFLCSWSVLCLQIPARGDTRFDLLWRRAWLTALCALGPEITLQLAMGQWSSARQSVKDFKAAKQEGWTMQHAFYADSGGYFLHTPDFPPFPIDAKQLLYLIEKKYIERPALSKEDIEDKNKVDVLLRIISIGQILWFIASVIARVSQQLVVTSLEITTAAFIFCSIGTTYCWWNKAADVASSETLVTTTTMAQILIDGGDAAANPYHRTPLDFISREEWHFSLYWTHWINILRHMHINFGPTSLPHNRLENTTWLDFKARGSLPLFIFMTMAYSAIFVASWNDHFPSQTESVLWRISTMSMMTTLALYFLITAFAFVLYPVIARCLRKNLPPESEMAMVNVNVSSKVSSAKHFGKSLWSSNRCPSGTSHIDGPTSEKKLRSRLSTLAAGIRNNTVLKDASLDVPLKANLPMYVVGFMYCAARTLIFVLDFCQLRSLPVSAYDGVDWNAFLPHLG